MKYLILDYKKWGSLIINMPSFLFLVILTFCKFCYFIRFRIQTYIIKL